MILLSLCLSLRLFTMSVHGLEAGGNQILGLAASLPAILGRGNYFYCVTITGVLGGRKAIRNDVSPK